MQAILTRRSIRKYTGQAVPEDVVEQLLRAAMAAPSARNEQPWQFVVVRDRRQLEAIAGASPYAGMTRGAQVAVVICADLTRETSPGYFSQDCSAATENLLIAANALGLGAVWLGFYPRDERIAALKQILGTPDTVIPFAVVPVGYPAENPGPADRFDRSRIHLDRW